jgi:hypothetical protein
VAALALAALVVAVHLSAPFKLLPYPAISAWLTQRSLGGFADAGGGLLRIYLRSQVLLIPAVLIGLHRLAAARTLRPRIGYAAGCGVLLMGLFVSLTRSLWIGLGVALVGYVVLQARRVALLVPLLGATAAAVLLLGLGSAVYQRPALLQAATTRLSPDLLVVVPTAAPTVSSPRPTSAASGSTPSGRPTPSAPTPTTSRPGGVQAGQAAAAQVRDQTLALHRQRIAERPVVGWGLGYNLDEVRDDGRTEYLYWDLLMKLGLLGVGPFLVLYGWAPWQVLRRPTLPLARTVCAGLAGVAATSYFNPFLNSTLGLAVLLLTVAAIAVPVHPPEPDADRPSPTARPAGRHRSRAA